MATNISLAKGGKLNINTTPFGDVRLFVEDEDHGVVVRLSMDEVRALIADLTERAIPTVDLTSTVHTVRGKVIGPEGSPYGVTHDMTCPGCQDTPFTASPRSESYWSS